MYVLFIVAALAIPNDPAALAFLNTLQSSSGGYISAPWGEGDAAKPTLRTTRTALRAYRLLGGQPPNREKTIEFLHGCYDHASGGFAAAPGEKPDPVSTSVALMIFGELNLPVDAYLERGLQYMNDHTQGFEQVRMVASSLEELDRTVTNAHKWLSDIERTRNQDGSFGNGAGRARETALNVVAEVRLGHPAEAEKVTKILKEGQREDGGFGQKPGPSDLESCYRVVRLLHRLGASPNNSDKLGQFIDRCRNSDGGYGRTPEEESSLHGTYYAAIIRGWLEELNSQVHRSWNFDSTSSSEIPPDWKQDRTLQSSPGSQWRTEPEVSSASNRVLLQASSLGEKKQFNLCIAEERQQDLMLTVKLKARAGQIDRGGGFVWRYQDPGNYYIMRWNPLEMNLRLYKVVDGVRSQLDTAEAPGDANAWHALRVVTVGRDIRGYFDGKLIIEAEDEQFLNSGRIGLWTKADAVTAFDELSLTSAWKEMIEELK